MIGPSFKNLAISGVIGCLLVSGGLQAREASDIAKRVKITWEVTSSEGLVDGVRVSQENPVRVGTVSARNVLVVGTPIRALGKSDVIPAGTELALAHPTYPIYCETQRRPKMASLRCLTDANEDGIFDFAAKTGETQWGTTSKSDIGYTIGPLEIRKWKPIAQPVPMTSLEKRPYSNPVVMRLHGYAYNMGSDIFLNLCFRREEGKSILGFDSVADYCLRRLDIARKDLPTVTRLAGMPVRVSDLDAEAKEMTVGFHGYPEGTTF